MAKKASKKTEKIAVEQEIPMPLAELPAPVQPKLLKAAGIGVTALLLVAFAGTSVYFYNQYKTTKTIARNGQISDKDVSRIVNKVGALIELPQETPTIATVADKVKLQKQPFFSHAEDGDKVLIYSVSKKAILYRPSTNKIIEVAPLNVQKQQKPKEEGRVAGVASNVEPVKVAVFNGSTVTGLASEAVQQLQAKHPSYVYAKGNAVKRDYEKSVVYDIKNKPEDAKEIAKLLGATIEKKLPEGEIVPDVDIFVIVIK